MAIHKTASGHIELLDQWGHGKSARGNWALRPATIISDDGDGHYAAWSYTGHIRDAASTAGAFGLRNDGRYVAVLSGSTVSMETPPDDFWVDRDGSFEPDTAKYPDVVAY